MLFSLQYVFSYDFLFRSYDTIMITVLYFNYNNIVISLFDLLLLFLNN